MTRVSIILTGVFRRRWIAGSADKFTSSAQGRLLCPAMTDGSSSASLSSRGQCVGDRGAYIGHRERLGDDVVDDGVEAVGALALGGEPSNQQNGQIGEI